jgi:hypothetical protein
MTNSLLCTESKKESVETKSIAMKQKYRNPKERAKKKKKKKKKKMVKL